MGQLRYEHCLTRSGFDGPYTILYHEHRPHAVEATVAARQPPALENAEGAAEVGPARWLRRRHYRTYDFEGAGAAAEARLPVLFSPDVTLSIVKPTLSDSVYFMNGDADELVFVRAGHGTVRSVFGDLEFGELDYVCLPKGMVYRFVIEGACELLLIECSSGFGLPEQWRNEVGQLRMDAPYCHRDFRRPTFRGPIDEGIRDVVVKRAGSYYNVRYEHSPLDVVGWDGTVYPWSFPILAFQPRVSSVHLPPTWHGTFSARGVLVCSFVPRPLDFHPDAIPCPYPHSSVDVDEVLYYVSGDFSSRSGVQPGSLTLHPRGIPHGPHPGRYEASIGVRQTNEVAVMLDCYQPLSPTIWAKNVEDLAYEQSFFER
ncbi:MAG TPA: homogentisate 1,2-dioxygenase [Polyangiaceae bacterium]|nr:homogentisate 1,2-dioxygenase [Polyangiaceae bacterium]